MSEQATTDDSALSPAELLETAEKLISAGAMDWTMYRAAILEAITALEANVRDIAFPVLKERIGDALSLWVEEKTRMDFDTRLGLLLPVATGLKVDKKDRLWNDYKKAKEIRNRVTHSGKKVTQAQARSVVDTVYEWMEYLKQARQANTSDRGDTVNHAEVVGRMIQASARLERVIYSAVMKTGEGGRTSRSQIFPVDELHRLRLVDDKTLRELSRLRSLRNKAAHAIPGEEVPISGRDVDRLNAIVDDVEAKLR